MGSDDHSKPLLAFEGPVRSQRMQGSILAEDNMLTAIFSKASLTWHAAKSF